MRSDNRLRILVAITNYGKSQSRYLLEVLAQYESWPCHVDAIIYSTDELNFHSVKISITNKLFDESIEAKLGHQHRSDFVRLKNDYDLFIYSENDILIPYSALTHWMAEQNSLPADKILGFLVYEESILKGEEIFLPSVSNRIPCIKRLYEINKKIFFSIHNNHQCCYVLTRRQLNKLVEERKYYFNPRGRCGYDILESAASDPYTCGVFEKIYPIDNASYLLIHHLPNKYVNFGVNEHSLASFREFISRANAVMKEKADIINSSKWAEGSKFCTFFQLLKCNSQLLCMSFIRDMDIYQFFRRWWRKFPG